MTVIGPMAILAAALLVLAVFTGVKASSADAGPAKRSGLLVMTIILALVGVAAGVCAWLIWRFSETFTF